MRYVKAIIECGLDATGRREFPTQKCEAYMVDTALDTDADQFSIDIADPAEEMRDSLSRDVEVRVTLFTVFSTGQLEPLHWGIADTVQFSSDDRILSIAGRDMSSVATDADAKPLFIRGKMAKTIILNDAQYLGLPTDKFQLAGTPPEGIFQRNADEKYWASWYRLYRKHDMWIWQEPDGTVIANKLKTVDQGVDYQFGVPPLNDTNPGNWIRVERAVVSKRTTSRRGKVWVWSADPNAGDLKFKGYAEDQTINSWFRKNQEIDVDSTLKSNAEALDEAFRLIHEGKVGAIEILLTVADPGFLFRQNKIARVRLPGILPTDDKWFVVGVRISGSSTQGAIVDVRLREPGYALSNLKPSPPTTVTPPDYMPPATGRPGGKKFGIRWANCFMDAAKAWHGKWDQTVFLGVLMAIAHQETGGMWTNCREGNATLEWAAKPYQRSDQYPQATFEERLAQWRMDWANYKENPLNPWGVNRDNESEAPRDAGVGPMQLTTRSLKLWADEYAGRYGEYEGGIWTPCANIWAGARYLGGFNCPTIWQAVGGYNSGHCGETAYSSAVRSYFDSTYFDKAKQLMGSGTGGFGIPQQRMVNWIQQTFAHEGTIHYAQVRPIPFYAENLFNFTTDCSGYVIMAYHVAGASDPSGNNFNGQGYTGNLGGHPVARSPYQIGDIALYGDWQSPGGGAHATICYSAGDESTSRWASHGQESGPVPVTMKYRSDWKLTVRPGMG